MSTGCIAKTGVSATGQLELRQRQLELTHPPGKCLFFLENKKRFCRFDSKPGNKYCGNHCSAGDPGPDRIPCPYDAGHDVIASELAKHLKKCPSRQHHDHLRTLPFFLENANAGSLSELGSAGTQDPLLHTHATSSTGLDKDGERIGNDKSKDRAEYVEAMGPQQLLTLIAKVHAAAKQVGVDVEFREEVLQPLDDAFLTLDEDPHSLRPFDLKHALQQASMIGHMQRIGLLNDAETTAYVEFGAGKAYLTLMVAEATAARTFVINDQRNFRMTADRLLRKMAPDTSFQRCTADIKDFSVARVPGMVRDNSRRVRPFVAIGKHLCGAATDFTLRSAVAANSFEREERKRGDTSCCTGMVGDAVELQDEEECRNVHEGLQGVCVAMCCHHRCTWKAYVGKGFMRELGFDAPDFEIISWMAGWALCGHEAPTSSQECKDGDSERVESSDPVESRSTSELDSCSGEGSQKHVYAVEAVGREEKRVIGAVCKRLIDMGRLRWLEQQGLASEIVCYASNATTGEKRLLLGTARQALA